MTESTNVITLKSARDKHFAGMAGHSSAERIEELTDQIVTGTLREKDVSSLVAERDALKAKRDSGLDDIMKKLAVARDEQDEARIVAAVKELGDHPQERLGEMLRQLDAQVAELKAKKRAVRRAFDARGLEERAGALVANLSESDRRLLLLKLQEPAKKTAS